MRDTVFYNRIPPVDHAIGYVTVPDDGRCENIPRDILRAHMDYKEGGPLCMEKPRLQRLLREKQPQTMGELAHGYGLAHRTAMPFSRSEESRVSEEFGTREDVLRYVISKGIGHKQAFDIAEQVASGKAAAGFAPGVEELLKEHDVPEAYVQDCKKIGYLYAEAHIIACLIDGFRIAWYYERLGELL